MEDASFRLERIEYASDGLVVSAYVYRPARPCGRLPVIVFVRGGFIVKDQAPVLLTMFRRLASRSALSWPEKVRTPILLMHGAADEQVPATQTLRLAEALAAQGSDYGVVI